MATARPSMGRSSWRPPRDVAQRWSGTDLHVVDQSVRESAHVHDVPLRDHRASEVADDLPHGDCDAAVLLLPEVHRLDRGVATEPGLRQGMSRSAAERIPACRVMKVMIHAGASRAARPKEHSDVSHAYP